MPPLLIDESNAAEQIALLRAKAGLEPDQQYQGCLPRRTRFGSIRGVMPASFYFKRIPRDEWKDRIREGQGTFLGDITRKLLPPHDQGRTNYCWAHGSVRAMEVLHAYRTGQGRLLSAESVAVPVTGGRNRGGTPEEAMNRLRSHGACRQQFWPLNNLDIRSAREGWINDALQNALLRWADVQNFDDQITLALHRIPVPIGLGWWKHLVCQLDPLILPDDSVGIGCDNSHGPDYGENGYVRLTERRGTADLGAFAPISDTSIA